MSALNIAEEMNVAAPERADAITHPTRPFLWSLRRELWENPSIIIAPAAVASIAIIAILISALRFTGQIYVQLQQDKSSVAILAPATLLVVPVFLGITMVLVAIFYSLDALLSERRDRSILFWKSLPVSDTTTVLSKMAVPMLLLPIITFAIAVAADIVVFVIESIALLIHHTPISSMWAGFNLFSILGLMAYTLVVVTLWYAPVYAWFLLVSAWTRRAALVLAVMPFFLLALFEKIAFHTHHVPDFIKDRFAGVFLVAFSHAYVGRNVAVAGNGNLNAISTPLHFLATPALWLGLLFTALALILIIRLRRSSDPI